MTNEPSKDKPTGKSGGKSDEKSPGPEESGEELTT
jgi:hypothetical protein